MAKTFRVSLYTPLDLSERSTCQVLWHVLNDPLVMPQKFGSTERARTEFDAEDCSAASEVYSDERMLFVRGKKNSFTAMCMSVSARLALWNFWWDLKVMEGRKRDVWLEFLYRILRELPPYYGSACSVKEYDAKHVVVKMSQAGAVTGSVGISAVEFQKFLPGVYWLTIFGGDLVEHFGSKLESPPHARSVALNPSQVVIILDGPVVPDNMPERIRAETELGEFLGAEYFFDRARGDIEYEPVPSLVRSMRGTQD
jgi:hypothetical protein